jgi:hypothetical protein
MGFLANLAWISARCQRVQFSRYTNHRVIGEKAQTLWNW